MIDCPQKRDSHYEKEYILMLSCKSMCFDNKRDGREVEERRRREEGGKGSTCRLVNRNYHVRYSSKETHSAKFKLMASHSPRDNEIPSIEYNSHISYVQ